MSDWPASIRKVALVGPVHPWRGGIAQYTMLLDRAFVSLGLEVHLASFRWLYPRALYPGDDPLARSPNALGFASEPHFTLHALHPLSWLTTVLQWKKWKPDLLVLQWWTPALAPCLWGMIRLTELMLDIPIVLICHNVLPHESAWYDRMVAHNALRGGHRFLVQNARERTLLMDLMHHQPAGRDIVVQDHPPYVYPHNPHVTREQARRTLGLPLRDEVILFCGLVRPYKGLEDLLAALPAVRARFPQARLVVAGEFWMDPGPIHRQVEKLGLQDAVTIENRYVPDAELALYLQAATALCVPYRHNTGSGVLAAAYGFPLALVHTGQPARSQPEQGIWVARPGHVAELSARLVDALSAQRTYSRPDRQEDGWRDLARSLLRLDA